MTDIETFRTAVPIIAKRDVFASHQLADLLAGNVSKATIDEVEGSVKIKAPDLNRLANQVTPFDKLSIEPDNRVATPTPADPLAPKTTAAIKLSGQTNVAGKVVTLTAYGQIALVSGAIQINIANIELDDISLNQIVPQLRQALAINPDGIDPNFFYAELLADSGRAEQALPFLERALAAPPRPGRALADAGRREEIKALMNKLSAR